MKALFLLLFWAWLMASSFIVSGAIVDYASPIATSAFRFGFACLIMLCVLVISWRKKDLSVQKKFKELFFCRSRLFHYSVISGSLVGFFIGLFVALKSTTPLNTSVLYTLVPLIGVFIARVWLHEALPWLRVVGFVIGSLGAMLVLFSTHDSGSFQWHSGDCIFIGACCLLALHVVSVQKWGRSLEALSGSFMIMLFGSIWLLPITLLWGDLAQVKWQTSSFWFYSLYLTVFTTLFTFVLQQHLVMSIGAGRLLAFSYTIPVWVAFFMAMICSGLSSLLDWRFILGLFCLGVALFFIDKNTQDTKLSYGSNSVTK